MEFATGALGTLLPKLVNLLQGEYNLQTGVRKNIKFLIDELEPMQVALRSVGEVPTEQQPELVKIWAREARELSYDMEDTVDTFLVRVEGPGPPSRTSFKKLMKSLLTMGKRHQIGEQIKEIKERIVDLAARYERYKEHSINPAVTTVDPRIASFYAKATDLIGINNAKEDLVLKLKQKRIVSIVGFGGLGKTTLAKAVYDEIKSEFDCKAFVTVSRNPDMKKFLKDMLHELGQPVYREDIDTSLQAKQLIDIAREFLQDKRYLIIIDDIWDASHWEVIKHALPDNGNGCRIITTTRNINVAKHTGLVYEMQPLSIDNARVLLYRRIFGTEDQEKGLDDELSEVSDRILKKCAGVPLAIITIASLLASKGRNKTKWDDIYNSIGSGMEDSLDVENMRKILSYSYYDLPPNLKTCLLYLSIWHEDYQIQKDRLIWLWRAEGFIQHDKKRRKSLFEVGESYFNELINRCMIQPTYWGNYSNVLWGCRVHDMVLDLLHSISSEENFVTVLTSTDETYSARKVRRLSLQTSKTCHALTQTNQSMLSARSIVIFSSALDQMPTLQCFKVLRVLDLKGCDLSQCFNLQYLGSLFHLRYLNLEHTRIHLIPEAIGNLKFLQVLGLRSNIISQLPKCVAQLTNLVYLSVHESTRIYSGIGNLTSLEELSSLRIDDGSADTIKGLGLLTELRVLHIWLYTDKYNDKLMESLRKLQRIQTIRIISRSQLNMNGLDAWVLPQLRKWITPCYSGCWFSALPTWMNNPVQFQDLNYLTIGIRELRQEDLQILGRLPALRDLYLEVDHVALGIVERRFIVGAGWFPCLLVFRSRGFVCPVMFHQGAMPRIRYLDFSFHMQKAGEIASSDGGFDCGLGNLPLLQEVVTAIYVQPGGASDEELQEAEGALRHAAEIHPNRPRFDIHIEEDEGAPLIKG